MNAPKGPIRTESLRIAGEKVPADRHFEVRYPYTGEVVAVVPNASVHDVRRAIDMAAKFRSSLTRHDRYRILMKAGEIIAKRRDELARLITLESGLCLKDTLYEVGRASDVLLFSANQALVDDGQVFSCDVTPHGRKRKVYTMREPLLGVITAITPFNHPLNQVIHKVAPAIATNNRVVLEAKRKDSACRLRAGRHPVRSGFAAADAFGDNRRSSRNCRRAFDEHAGRSGDFHRWRRRRQGYCSEGGLQAAGAGARRQRSDHRDGRRRSRRSRNARRQWFVQELGTALHRSEADAGPTRTLPTASSNCWWKRRRP